MVKTLLHPEIARWFPGSCLTIVWTFGDNDFPAETLTILNVLSSIVFGAIPGLLLINYWFVRRHITRSWWKHCCILKIMRWYPGCCLTIVWTSGDSGFPAKTLATLNVLSSIVFGAIPGLFLINYRFVRRTQHINGENIVASWK